MRSQGEPRRGTMTKATKNAKRNEEHDYEGLRLLQRKTNVAREESFRRF